MHNLQRTFRSLAALALAAAGFLGTAQAVPVVSISPSSQNLLVGDTTSVDIVVSGLMQPDEAIGGFSITLDFDSALLEGVGFTNDPDGRMGALPDEFSFGFDGLGSLDLFFVADAAETQASLAAAQNGSFRLATVSFLGLAPGLSPLTLTSAVLSTWDGGFNGGPATIASTSRNGSICVVEDVDGSCNTVPEPGTYGLAGVALLAAGWAGRSRRRKQTIA